MGFVTTVHAAPPRAPARLARFGPQQFAVAIDTGPIAVDKRHRVAADRTIRRRSLVESRQDGQLDIVFVHGQAVPRVGECSARIAETLESYAFRNR